MKKINKTTSLNLKSGNFLLRKKTPENVLLDLVNKNIYKYRNNSIWILSFYSFYG